MTTETIVRLPPKAAALMQPARFKSLRGGRDGAKSWTVATLLLERAAANKEFVVCARENMNSIADSCHRLLCNRITDLGLGDQYYIEKSRILHRWSGSEFVFKGLRHNPDAIKSLEGATILWVEEAQSVSKDSWDKAIPTVRRPGSEIWLTWNPQLETDDTYQRFVVSPPPDCLDIQMNFADNPWASAVLIPEREKLRAEKPDEYNHIWLGMPRRSMEGAIYAAELRLAEEQGRITKVEYAPGNPVYTGWDLGDSDMTAIWFIQPVMGQYRVIDYMEDSHQPLSYYLNALETKGYVYGKDYFPWDAASRVLVGSLEQAMRQRGRNVQVLPRTSREGGIDLVREMLGTAWFDAGRCADGLQRLRYYRYGQTNVIDPATGMASPTRQPVHDDNSHGADAMRSFAVGFRMGRRGVEAEKPKDVRIVQPPRVMQGSYAPFG